MYDGAQADLSQSTSQELLAAKPKIAFSVALSVANHQRFEKILKKMAFVFIGMACPGPEKTQGQVPLKKSEKPGKSREN